MGKYTISEPFEWSKFWSGFLGFFNPTLWAKDLVSIFNIRKIIIYAVIITGIFIYGYSIGNQNVPVQIDLGYGKEAIVNLGSGEFMWIKKTGEVFIIDNVNPEKAKILRIIKVKDLGALKGKLSAIGFQFSPIAVVGYGLGIGTDGGFEGGIEGGVGISFFRYFRGSIEAIATQKGIYLGTSYRLDRLSLSNSSIGIAVGKGYQDFTNSNYRVMIYGSIKF